MVEEFVSTLNTNGFVFARSDSELEEHLREAVKASMEDYELSTELEETLPYSDFTAAEAALSSLVSNLSFSNEDEASSSSEYGKEYLTILQEYGFDFEGYEVEKGGNSRGKEMDTGQQRPRPGVQKACGICYEDPDVGMFESISCLHRFCHPCMTTYIRTQLEQKRHQIYCPHESCRECLTPEECRNFLPVKIIEAWSAITVEAEIPDSQKVYCPFPHCSAMLVEEDVAGLSAEEITNVECPFCHRMFCVRCMVPWHADLNCEEFQKLPPDERSGEDRQLFKLAEASKWKRCGKCKSMIEKNEGCNHMTCSQCHYEFCYKCGTGWTRGRSNCDCS